MTKDNQENSNSEVKNSKLLKPVLIGLVIVIILMAVLLVWLYTGSLNSTKEVVFSRIPLPVAMVGYQPVSSTNYFDKLSTARIILTDTDGIEDTVLNGLIDNKKSSIMARQRGVSVNRDEVDEVYARMQAELGVSSKAELEQLIRDTEGVDLNQIQTEIEHRALIESLALWYNQQESLNQASYTSARGIMDKLSQGQEFASLAQSSSEDEATQVFAGDSGFIPYQDMLPEFKAAVKDIEIGESKLVISRYGLHIIQVGAIQNAEDSDDPTQKTYQISQIFIQPEGFEQWYEAELNKIKSYKFL